MNKVAMAIVPLHYGREWLWWAIRSVRDVVKETHVFYTETPTNSHFTNVPCPESREELKAIVAYSGAHWHEYAGPPHEGPHVDYGRNYCYNKGADMVLRLDADEIWPARLLQYALQTAADNDAKDLRVPLQHYWRSVDWVCRDDAMPVRITKPTGEGEVSLDYGHGLIHHFGYAQSPKITKYKWLIHGHLAELRPGWWDERFMAWHPAQLDVHPTSKDYWNAAAFSKSSIAHLIGDHPYFDMEFITDSLVNTLDLPQEIIPAIDVTPFGRGSL